MKQKIYVCSFANMALVPSAMRFVAQAKAMGIFDNIMHYNEYSLDAYFKKTFSDRLGGGE